MVTPVTIEGLTMEASSTESTEMQVHVQWPVLPGHQAQRGDGDVGPGPGEGIPGRRPAVQRAAARDQRLCLPFIASGRTAAARLTEDVTYGARGATTNLTVVNRLGG